LFFIILREKITEHGFVTVEWVVCGLDYFEVAVENAFFANVHKLLFYVVPHIIISYSQYPRS